MIFLNCENCKFYYDVTEFCEIGQLEGNDKLMYDSDDEAVEMECILWEPKEEEGKTT